MSVAADGAATTLTNNDESMDQPISWSPSGDDLAVRSVAGKTPFEAGEAHLDLVDESGVRTRVLDSSDVLVVGWNPVGYVRSYSWRWSPACLRHSRRRLIPPARPMPARSRRRRQRTRRRRTAGCTCRRWTSPATTCSFRAIAFFSQLKMQTGVRDSRANTTRRLRPADAPEVDQLDRERHVAGRRHAALRRDRSGARVLRLRVRHLAGHERHDGAARARTGSRPTSRRSSRRTSRTTSGVAWRSSSTSGTPRRKPARSSASTRARPAHHRELVLRGVELQRLHRPRREPQQPSARPGLRRLAAHAVQLRPGRTTGSATTAASIPTRSWCTAASRIRRLCRGSRCGRRCRSTLPDLANPYWRSPMDLKNFQSPVREDGHPDAEAAAHRPDGAAVARDAR